MDNYRQQMYRRNQCNNTNYRTQRNTCSECNTNRTFEGCNECEDNSIRREIDLGEYRLGMAYVPWHEWGFVYETCKGLDSGTVFPELDMPFMGRSCARK